MRIGEVLGLRFYAKLSFPPNSVALGIAGFSVLGIKKIEKKKRNSVGEFTSGGACVLRTRRRTTNAGTQRSLCSFFFF